MPLGGVLSLVHRYAARGGAGAGILVRRPVVIVHAGVFFHRLRHGEALPGTADRNFHALIGHRIRPADFPRDLAVHVLDEIHHVAVIAVCLIHLDGGKLGIMRGIHSLVAENPPHLVHLVEAAHNQAL